jgi:hypothetical protein
MRVPSFRSSAALIRALQALARTEVLFRFGGSGAVTAESGKRMQPTAGETDLELQLEDILVARAGLRRAKRAWPLRVHCLQSSLTLHALLEQRGIGAQVLIGVRMDESELESHAWVQVNDYVVDDAHAVHNFAVIDPSALTR